MACWKSMAIDEELPHPCLYREAPFWVKVSKVGYHNKVPLGLRVHTQLLGKVKFMVIAWINAIPEWWCSNKEYHVCSKVVQQITIITQRHVENPSALLELGFVRVFSGPPWKGLRKFPVPKEWCWLCCAPLWTNMNLLQNCSDALGFFWQKRERQLDVFFLQKSPRCSPGVGAVLFCVLYNTFVLQSLLFLPIFNDVYLHIY